MNIVGEEEPSTKLLVVETPTMNPVVWVRIFQDGLHFNLWKNGLPEPGYHVLPGDGHTKGAFRTVFPADSFKLALGRMVFVAAFPLHGSCQKSGPDQYLIYSQGTQVLRDSEIRCRLLSSRHWLRISAVAGKPLPSVSLFSSFGFPTHIWKWYIGVIWYSWVVLF